jgi:hypothetical protein
LQKTWFSRPSRLVQRDVRVVTNVEVGCDGRDGGARRARAVTDGEVVWSWPLDAEVCATRQRRVVAKWGQERRSPGRARRTPLKPIARGRPGLSGCTCGTCRLHSFEQAGHGPQPRSGLPRALSFREGDDLQHHSDAHASRERLSTLSAHPHSKKMNSWSPV